MGNERYEDIVRRCKAHAYSSQLGGQYVLANVLTLAAAEIETLRAQIERLKQIKSEASHVCGHEDY